jgi:bifunctional non-homologous end joining protein LigD
VTDKLQAYNEKRDFGKTAEPKGGTSSGEDRQFVVQLHYASRTHYDFRLEHDGVLVSWAVPKASIQNPQKKQSNAV